MKKILLLNDYLKFIPLLLVYLLICIVKSKNILVGDEDDYLRYANNLLNGYYAHTSYDYDFLWNGPGYPIFLTIFEFFNCSYLIPKLCNALFLYFGITLFFKTLKLLIPEKKAIYVALILGLYYPFLAQAIPFILTEALCFFLTSLFSYNLLLYSNKNSNKNKWLAAFSLGYLVLTKIIFAYVVMALFAITIPFLFNKKSHKISRKYAILLFLSFSFTTPYLAYTYSLTNKFLYFADSGGMSLYWMSTPYEDEYGDWHSFTTLKEKPKLYKNHGSFVNSIQNLHPVDKDIALKEKAIENIKNNKFKFFKNWMYNLNRLFFNSPYSTEYKPSKSVFINTMFKGVLLFLTVITVLLTLKHSKKIKPIFYFLGSFIIIYIGGVSLLSSYPRFLDILLPMLLIWISYMLQKFIILKLK
ncbi:hypothetical protein [Winogradskyella sp.]|uniref:hypothetical protein n=1 Tax=Winogradskyella sp. TaxID=1883156 RepID=UPI0025EAB046|nr:hypothetical protein [Winogradskyella sp.]